MSTRKTIEQLWKENGEKFPFGVSAYNSIRVIIIGRTPKGKWVGWDRFEKLIQYDGNYSEWSLYIPPKPKKIVYEWLCEDIIGCCFFTVSNKKPNSGLKSSQKTGRQFEVDDE